MNKRMLASFLGAFLLGTAVGEYRQVIMIVIFATYIIYQGMLMFRTLYFVKRKSAGVCLLFALFLAGFLGYFLSDSSQKAYNKTERILSASDSILVQGEIYQKESKNNVFYYYLKDCMLQSDQIIHDCNHILVSQNTDCYFIGETICIKGKPKLFEVNANEGGYNEKQYYRSLNIDFVMEYPKTFFSDGKKSLIFEKIYDFKQILTESILCCMQEKTAGTMLAMLLADTSHMDSNLKKIYQNAGVSHFYAISGLHISMIGMGVYYFLRKCRCSYYFSGILSGGMMILYGIMIGFGISASRAIGMFLFILIAKARGASYDRITSLAVMASYLVANHTSVLHHAGFLLSFGAVGGVILGTYLKEHFWQNIHPFWEKILISLCIQLVTMPILCYFFYEISVYSIFVNLIIIPCMGVLLAFGIMGTLAGILCTFAGKILFMPCNFILWIFEIVCTNSLKMPYAVLITGKMSIVRLFIWYFLIFILLLFWKKQEKILFRFLSVCICCGILLVIPAVHKTRCDFLDVGQGDGICFMQEDGTVLFLDGGSTSVVNVGAYRVLPFLKYHGIRKVNYWFLSHLDEDHINGFYQVVESGFPVEHLVMAKGSIYDEEYRKMLLFAKERQILVLSMEQYSYIEGIDSKWRMTCLYPQDENKKMDKNAASMVLVYECEKFCGMFAGDISKEEEKELVTEWKRMGRYRGIDVWKASHHGSAKSNSIEFLKWIRPKCTIISCGLNNSYGHPAKETLQRLSEIQTSVYETRYMGQITIESNKNVKVKKK